MGKGVKPMSKSRSWKEVPLFAGLVIMDWMSWSYNLSHHLLNSILLVIAGALIASELTYLSIGMAGIYTSALNAHHLLDSDDQMSSNGNPLQSNANARPNPTPNQCPEGPHRQWGADLDAASKAYLAPIVFSGKLISISEDYGGRIGATFHVKKLIKNQSSLSAHLVLSSHVTLYFVRNKLLRPEPPYCAIFLDDHIISTLRPQEKYIIFASPPFTLFSNSVHHFPAIARTSNPHQSVRPNSANGVTAGAIAGHSPSTHTTTHTTINLSAFVAPEPHNKRSARLVRKVLCPRCGVPTKGNLRLGCKVSGNPLPRVEWFRNGKRLKNRGRVAITTRRQTSRLEIRRVSHLTDSGLYECRARNVVTRQPTVAKKRVRITNQSKRKPHSSSPSSTSTRGPLWPQVRPCPIPSFCLNGGTCTLYEAVGEYVCQCAEGYMGQRCESKDIYLKLTLLARS
ncbi:unnamed protein product [Medioppia subpectinata]|uniref:Uncharacterized protein n=1 Tax=Medioppia subpectinata TaxID=1979941 RepID=A0A7R9Q171_9ACAR|nr:unnamed protein product [Medioppia subpectinata]CAG2108245.1 unnamed protein product [Medioppia subpectinata]